MEDRQSIRRALEVIAEAAQPTGAVWLVGGSAGLMLRGLQLAQLPRDLDLYADHEDARLLHQALAPYALDEQQENVSGIYASVLSHYLIAGVQVELVGGFVVTTQEDRYQVEVREALYPLQLELSCGTRRIGLVPLAHEMWFNMLRGRRDRVELIAAAVREERPVHQAAFDCIEARNPLSSATMAKVHACLEQAGAEGLL
ncbi:hypothetical protein [Paenibacillus sp. GCM10027626]|uniref:hypothetical protein n=1 Tax=Paenibacillus sp. GCM10027626 TaxID=3273411 RepID=UPI00363E3380